MLISSKVGYLNVAQRSSTLLSLRALSSTATSPLQGRVLAIRREDQSPWERRAPLSPHHVRELVNKGVKVIVQPCNRRGYSMVEYQEAGAVIQEEMDEASAIFGIKQVAIDALIPNKTFAFFSHTIKAQPHNMPLLDAILQKRIRLIDYERIIDPKTNMRLVAIGHFAGIAGMIDILHGLGLRLIALGHHTPFMHIAMPQNYPTLKAAKAAIHEAGMEIASGRLPASIGPLTFVFTGAGNVSRGAQEIFRELPHEFVSPKDLPKIAQQGSTRKLYGCIVDRRDNNIRREPSALGLTNQYDDEEFLTYPERYMSTFAAKVAPHASVIVNGVFWQHPMPRLITLDDAKRLLRPSTSHIDSAPGCPRLPHRLIAIGDISADLHGSMEFMQKCTSIDAPFTIYDAQQNVCSDNFAGPGVLVCSIDNMPAQLPREATDFFGSQLFPFVGDILKSDATTPLPEFDAPASIRSAIIASNGELAAGYRYIADLRAKLRRFSIGTGSSSDTYRAIGGNKVLVLGAGFVAGPAVEYLARDKGLQITVASAVMDEATKLSQRFSTVEPMLLDITRRPDELERVVKDHDLVVSMLPAPLHAAVAQHCVKYRKNLVTTSYVSRAMMALDQPARRAGITLLNEMGLDPGIDHMLAARCLDEMRDAGSRIESFISWCGGLPAPECSDNPLRYKFSWAPRNVFANLMLGARWLEKGQVRHICEGGEILDAVAELDFLPGLALEGIPNRDSVPYKDIYDLGKDAHTCLRGTVRYRGFIKAVKAIVRVGLASDQPLPSLHPSAPAITWRRVVADVAFGDPKMPIDELTSTLMRRYYNGDAKMLHVLLDLGLLDDSIPVEKRGTPVDTVANHLAKRLSFGPHDRDLCILRHDITALTLSGHRETHSFTLTQYGTLGTPTSPPVTAMALCVGASAGIAARMLLDGEIHRRGVVLPVTSDCYKPILNRLQQEGIYVEEKIFRH